METIREGGGTLRECVRHEAAVRWFTATAWPHSTLPPSGRCLQQQQTSSVSAVRLQDISVAGATFPLSDGLKQQTVDCGELRVPPFCLLIGLDHTHSFARTLQIANVVIAFASTG